MLKVIFLDVVGPLNTRRSYQKACDEGRSTAPEDILLDEEALDNLKTLVEKTGAVIVVTSAWRRYEKAMFNLGRQLYKKGMRIRGETDYITPLKSVEIRAWLDRNMIAGRFVILDDETDMGEFTDTNLVICPQSTGFGEAQLRKALEILNAGEEGI